MKRGKAKKTTKRGLCYHAFYVNRFTLDYIRCCGVKMQVAAFAFNMVSMAFMTSSK